MTVLCHGAPTLSNILFKYGADGQPTEAMVTTLIILLVRRFYFNGQVMVIRSCRLSAYGGYCNYVDGQLMEAMVINEMF